MNMGNEIILLQNKLEQERTARKALEEKLKATTEALQQSREFSKSLTNTVPNIIYILDLEQDRCTYVNKHIQNELGYSKEDIVQMKGHVFRSIIIPEDQARLLENITLLKQAEDEQIIKAEYRVWDNEGKVKYLYCRERVFKRHKNGQVHLILGAAEDISTLREKNVELKEQKDFYEAILNNLPSDIAVFDHELRYRYANPAAFADKKMREWVIGKTNEDYFALKNIKLDQREERIWNLKSVKKEKKALEFEEMVINQKGTPSYHLRRLNPILDEQNTLKLIVGYSFDITERKRHQDEIVQNERRKSAILEAIPDLMYIIRRDGTILEMLNAEKRILVSADDKIIGKSIQNVLPEPLGYKVMELIQRVLKASTIDQLEFKLELSEGTRYFEQRMSKYTDDEVLSIFREVTDQRKMALEIKEKNELIELTLNTSPNYIYISDANGRMVLVNQAVASLFGRTKEEMVGLKRADFFPLKEEYASFDASDKKVIEERIEVETQSSFIQAGGEGVWVKTVRRPLITPGGEVRVLGISTDETDWVLAERELQKAKELAEDSVRLKESFLANMSHEIRTPMNGIIGIGDLLAKTTLDEIQQNYVKVIRHSADNLLVIINDILDLGKIGANKLELEEIPFNLSEVMDVARQTLICKAEEKGILLNVGPGCPERTFLKGDPYRLNQVLLNLMNNAIKFTKEGGVTLSCRVLEENQAEVGLEFSVADTGIGIPKEKHQDIFEEFIQANASTTRNYGGTGLGLSICKKLVEMQGGRIWVESKEAKGSVFKFILTFPKCTDALPHILNEEVDYNRLNGIRILLAEDNEINVLLARTILESRKVKVDRVRNGKEALEQVKEQEYDIILMDIQMPEMNGMEATKLIRSLTDRKKAEIPVIALTANAFKKDAEKYLKAGMDDYLSKPFKEEELFLKVLNHLPKRSTKGVFPANHKKVKASVSAPNEVVGKEIQASVGVSPTAVICDFTYLKERTGGDKEFMGKMGSLFLEQVPTEFGRLQNELKVRNIEEVEQIAHKLKSTVSLFGAVSMLEHLQKIEDLASSDSEIAQIEQLCLKVIAESNRAVKEVQIFFADF